MWQKVITAVLGILAIIGSVFGGYRFLSSEFYPITEAQAMEQRVGTLELGLQYQLLSDSLARMEKELSSWQRIQEANVNDEEARAMIEELKRKIKKARERLNKLDEILLERGEGLR